MSGNQITLQDVKNVYATSFELVSQMNEAFGNPKGDWLAIDLVRIKNQCKNILDEYKELMSAIDEGNIPKVRDALCDIHVFAYGAHHLMGLDADLDMDVVVQAVMSRFIKDPEDQAATVAKHRAKGIKEFYFEGEYPKVIMKSACDQPDAPKGKFLKSASYVEPEFEEPAQVAVFVEVQAEGAAELHWGLTKEQQGSN